MVLVNAVMVTHGSLGAELIRTAEAILGPQEGVGFVSNTGSSLEEISEQVRSLLSEAGEAVFLFVDLLGGSCSHACQHIRRLHPEAVIITGVNLPMLLDFFVNRDRVPLDQLVQRLVTKAREGIRCL